MTFQQYRYLIAIAKYRSISQAAKALYVTQPSISNAIHQLERELGIQILIRSNRGVQFTPDGQDLLQYARMLVAQEQNIRTHFRRQHQSPRHTLTVASQHYSFGAAAIQELMQAYQKDEYQLSFWEERSTAVAHHVATGTADLGITTVADLNRELLVRRFADQALVFTPLMTTTAQVFINCSHPLAQKQSITAADLKSFPCLTYRHDDLSLSLLEEFTSFARQVVYVQDRGTMDNLLAHTAGYNLGTGVVTPGYVDAGIIARPFLPQQAIKIGYLQRAHHAASAEEQRFIAILKDILTKLTD